MKIQSRFKDYYDYVPQLYGGGDPKIVYVREPLTEFNESGFRPSVSLKHKVYYHLPDPFSRNSRFENYRFSVLVIMDRPFMMISKAQACVFDDWKIYNWDENFLDLKDRHYFWSDITYQYPKGERSDNILALTKKVGTPVYLIESAYQRTNDVSIQSEIPILNHLGVASFYPAVQLYQDLAYFIGNTMKDSPDTKPPVVVDDLTRLQQYGFDKKVSFRHRK